MAKQIDSNEYSILVSSAHPDGSPRWDLWIYESAEEAQDDLTGAKVIRVDNDVASDTPADEWV